MTKLIKLIVAKEHNEIYPLLDNNNNRVNPRHFEDLNINLVSALSNWQQNYDESYKKTSVSGKLSGFSPESVNKLISTVSISNEK